MVLLAKRVSASTVASISTSVSSASLQRMMRSAMCSRSLAVKRAPLGWFEDWLAGVLRGRLLAGFFLVRFIFQFCATLLVRAKARRYQVSCNWLLRKRHAHFNVAETGWRRAVACAHGLHRLAFAAVRRAPERPVITRTK